MLYPVKTPLGGMIGLFLDLVPIIAYYQYHVDPLSPAYIPEAEPSITQKKKRRPEVIATKSMPHVADNSAEVPHQWTTKEVETLIQIRLTISDKLKTLCIDVDHIQAQSKYNTKRVRREYTKRFQPVNKNGASWSPLFEWEFYKDLEPSFRTCQQIAPDHMEFCHPTPESSTGTEHANIDRSRDLQPHPSPLS